MLARGEQHGKLAGLREDLEEQEKSSLMLVQAHAGRAQAAKGFWDRPRKKSQKLLVPAGGGQHRQPVSLREGFRSKKIRSQCWCRLR